MKKLEELSLFLPAYNEEKNLADTVERAVPILKKVARKYELLIINDGSRDNTGEIAEKLAQKYPFVRVITHGSNQGYGVALRSGFYASKYNWIAFTDSDGQFDFSEIEKLIEKSDQADIVAGFRIDRQDPPLRRFFGRGWTFLANLLLGVRVRDVDCAFKLIKKEVIERIPRLQSTIGGANPELLAKAVKEGFDIIEVGVHHYPRKDGKQTGGSLRAIFVSFIDLGKLWWQLR